MPVPVRFPDVHASKQHAGPTTRAKAVAPETALANTDDAVPPVVAAPPAELYRVAKNPQADPATVLTEEACDSFDAMEAQSEPVKLIC